MNIYNPENIKNKIVEILNTEYERMYPFELEKALGVLSKEAKANNDEEVLKMIQWEYSLLNATLGHTIEYNGKMISEISNKWMAILLNKKDITSKGEFSSREVADDREGKGVYLEPLSNPPFCEWQEGSVDYYKQRYENTTSELSKARYAFVIMIFSKGQERLDWMKKSVEGWLKTAEKYVSNKKYAEFYEIPPFAYDFALKLSLSFGDKILAKKVLESLHSSILKILDMGEKRWHIEFFEVEAKYITKLRNTEPMVIEGVNKLKEIITKLEQKFQTDKPQNKDNHFLRHHLRILIDYKIENEYDLTKKIADSYISEAEYRPDLIKSSLYTDAIKRYKLMESRFPNKKDEISRKIEELTLKIKEVTPKTQYKEVSTSFTITREQINSYITHLKKVRADIFEALLTDNSLFPKISNIKSQTEELKKNYPLLFIIPVVIYNKEEPILKHVEQAKIFDYRARNNILIGVKMAEVFIKMTLEELEKELKIKTLDKADELLKAEELKDIYPTLKKGFSFIFGGNKEFIAGLHVITPYFEEIIRRIVKKVGKVEVILQSHNSKYFRGIELGTLLSDEEIGKLIGIDFQKSLKVLLVDSDQTNLRNELLHGRWESKKIVEAEVLFVAYCLLKLVKTLKDIK